MAAPGSPAALTTIARDVAERRDFEPRLRACLGALEALRQSSPAAELGERVLDLVEPRDRREAAIAVRRCRAIDLVEEIGPVR